MSDRDEMPFGEDITNPDSRTIPEEFHGQWCYGGNVDHVIEADRLVIRGASEQVVAVRFIDGRDQIAIVTRDSSDQYALHYRGLTDGGSKLVDLESADMVYDRC